MEYELDGDLFLATRRGIGAKCLVSLCPSSRFFRRSVLILFSSQSLQKIPTYKESIINPTSSSSRSVRMTNYKWGFASKLALDRDEDGETGRMSKDAKALEKVREDVDAATAGESSAVVKGKKAIGPMLPPGLSRPDSDSDDDDIGPTPRPSSHKRPSAPNESDRQYAHEQSLSQQHLSRATRAPRDNSALEAEGSRSVGRERMQENKRAKRDANKSFSQRKDEDDGAEVGEDVLMGSAGNADFKAKWVAPFLSLFFRIY